jgi:hypothetical protein
MNSSTKPIHIIRYREFFRRLQLSSVSQRIHILRKSIDTARQELRALEGTLIGRDGNAA